mgnify:CR=1 FL=1
MVARRDEGFGLSEALVAAVLGAVVVSAVVMFVVQQSGQAAAHPDRADLQQRARAAIDILFGELGSAVAGIHKPQPAPGSHASGI